MTTTYATKSPHREDDARQEAGKKMELFKAYNSIIN